jgi:hypothetical protein
MIARRPTFRFLMPALFAVSLAGVAAADKGVHVTAASAPAGTDARVTVALSESIKAQVNEARLASKLRGYTISPALIQLRRFIEPGQKRARTVCVVELALADAERGFVANVRGNASSFGATQLDTLDAAAHAAVARLPEALAALQDPRRTRIASR